MEKIIDAAKNLLKNIIPDRELRHEWNTLYDSIKEYESKKLKSKQTNYDELIRSFEDCYVMADKLMDSVPDNDNSLIKEVGNLITAIDEGECKVRSLRIRLLSEDRPQPLMLSKQDTAWNGVR